MSAKRSRIGNSTSQFATQISTTAAAAVSSTTVMKGYATGKPSQSKILNIACPVSVGEADHVKIGGFLERCHYCKKRIAENSEVFMYSNLCAFCSAECRDLQIVRDQSAKEQLSNPKRKVAHR